jgi:hypothetical protein
MSVSLPTGDSESGKPEEGLTGLDNLINPNKFYDSALEFIKKLL